MINECCRLCDPYLVVYTNGASGKKLIAKDTEEMKKETLNPNFYKCYEINATLPGDSELEVEVWDWDQVLLIIILNNNIN